MTESINPARFIRTKVFEIQTQREFAELLGYPQSHISRFENGMRLTAEAIERIQNLALQRGIDWDNNWLFAVPKSQNRRVRKNSSAVAA